jgi:beta-fructofuranosidase
MPKTPSNPPIPRIGGEYSRIYFPEAGPFAGPDSENLTAGQFIENWIPNDHTFVKDPEGRWHAFGITGPETPKNHEAEWQAFHIVSEPRPVRELMDRRHWTEHPKVLAAADRPGERKDLWAPFVVEQDGLYHMFYGPCEMRMAVSENLFDWEPQGAVFEQEGHARDPWIVDIGGLWHMVYIAGSDLYIRASKNLREWSDTPVKIFSMPRPGAPESPMLIQYKGLYYLFWTIHDGHNGPYDNRTFVYCSSNPLDFSGSNELTMLTAHAPELIDDGGQWFISSVERPRRGVSLALLVWD